MTNEEIEAFLVIVESGNISNAARKLLVSQSTLSQRLKRLEDSLGVELIYRNKGQKNIELTSKGTELIPLAQRWVSIYKDIHVIKENRTRLPITIASIALVNEVTFVPLYNEVIQEYYGLDLTINTHHSDEIYQLVANHLADIGFVYSQLQLPEVITTPIYSEKMYLITNKTSTYYDGISVKDLDSEKEIYLKWGIDYEIWHEKRWGRNKPLLKVNTGASLIKYLNEPERWSIGPISLIESSKSKNNLVYYSLEEEPPLRICYQLVSRYSKPSKVKAIQIFQKAVQIFITTNELVSNNI
ncbi:LysR family transcriptional regulator [Senegalia sp. (in: firmicutes)]|uniref:LysR family transcriptional regulator n=1 Tax=Bacillota TaxID=1239 RepID=UPI003F96DF0E